jgi:hypothetical protein
VRPMTGHRDFKSDVSGPSLGPALLEGGLTGHNASLTNRRLRLCRTQAHDMPGDRDKGPLNPASVRSCPWRPESLTCVPTRGQFVSW